jgi:hypothetical protein
MLAVAAYASRCIFRYLPCVISESLVAADTGLVHDDAGAVLISGDEAAEWLPGSDVTILAVESLVDLVNRAGCMDTMRTHPDIIGHPTKRHDESDDESERRTMRGDCVDGP